MKSRPIKEKRLGDLESDFEPLFISCLRECAGGRWGLFGQNDSSEVARYRQWDEAERLREIADEIQELRAEFGQPNAQVDRFVHYCSIRGSNVPGEPKLAKALLYEILKEKANQPDKATSC
jgi:hypothetical protein